MIEGLPLIRDYQRAGVEDTFARWAAGDVRVPVVMATGLGKSRVAAELVDAWLARNPGKRALVIAHTRELIGQLASAMRDTGHAVGVVMGARNAPTARIVVASRQTLANARRRAQLRAIGLVVIDECHFSVRDNTYGAILEHFGAFDDDPRCVVAGFTATLSRSDKKKLSSIWQECTFSRDIMFGIRNGYLLDVRGERIIVDEMDMRNVRSRGGDFDERSLGEELERSFAIETIAGEVKRIAGDLKGLAFWPLVATAEHAARVFTEAGIPSGVVYGAQDERERARVLAAHRARDIMWVHNAMALTVGYDDPDVDAVLMGRATKSRTLYVQMAGRALRVPERARALPPSARPPALLIDVTGASAENDLSLFIDLSPARALAAARERAPEATLGELDEIALVIEEEMAEKRARASFEFESEEYAGPTTTRAFDPLARTKAWERTRGGTYFLKASVHARADAFAFVVESLTGAPETFDLVLCSVYAGRDRWVRASEVTGVPMEQAFLHGESVAGDAYNTRSGARRRTHAPSEKQRALAAQYGITAGAMTSGELGAAIDLEQASVRIDPLVAAVRSRMKQSRE